MEQLFDADSEIDTSTDDGRLLKSLHECNWTRAEELISQGKGIKGVSSTWTALHFATFNAAPVSVVEGLVKAGSDVNAVDKSGFPCLYFAAQKGSVDVCRVLLAAGANPNWTVPASSGMTPVHACIFPEAPPELLQAFFDAHGNPNVQAHATSMAAILRVMGVNTRPLYDGVTPLIVAVIKDVPIPLILRLLENGADPSIRDMQGKSALDHARSLKRTSLIPLLAFAENADELLAKRCSYCKKLGQAYLPRCSRCDQAAYCSQVCQRADWQYHKNACTKNRIKT